MSELHAANPGGSLIESECSPGVVNYPTPEIAIASLRNWSRAVELWNLALDPHGASNRWVSDYASDTTINYGVTAGLDNVALRNPDGSKVLVAYNNSPHPIRFQVAWRERAFIYTLGAGGTVTFTWR